MYADTGSPEMQLLLAIPPEGIPRKELQASTVPFFVLKSALESSEPLGSALLLEVSVEDFLRLESEYDMRSLTFIVIVDIVKRSCVYKDSYANC